MKHIVDAGIKFPRPLGYRLCYLDYSYIVENIDHGCRYHHEARDHIGGISLPCSSKPMFPICAGAFWLTSLIRGS